MVLAHNRLYDAMIKNNIDPSIIQLDNIKFFTDNQINYILALKLDSYRLKSVIYLTGLGVFEKIEPGSHYLIIRALKKANNEETCNKISNILLSESNIEKALRLVSNI